MQVKASGLSRSASLNVGSLLVKTLLYKRGRKPRESDLPARDHTVILVLACVLLVCTPLLEKNTSCWTY